MGKARRGPPPTLRAVPPARVERAIKAVEMHGAVGGHSFAKVIEEVFADPLDDDLRAEATRLAERLRSVPKD